MSDNRTIVNVDLGSRSYDIHIGAGLLDTLSEAEILDLLAYLRSGGQPDHPLYETP